MTLRIEVTVPEAVVADKRAADYLADAMAAICFVRNVSLALPKDSGPRCSPLIGGVAEEEAKETEEQASAPEVSETSADADPQRERERGKPAPGKSRRTKAEIEEDEAADLADQQEAKAAISTGDERTDPENPEDDAQDAADEAADEANQSDTEATRDDVRALMMEYSKAKGMPALNSDMSSVLKTLFSDGDVTKLSEIPEDPKAFADVIAALSAKLEG